MYPSIPYTPNISWMDPYLNSLKIVNKLYSDSIIGLTLQDFNSEGHQVLVFDFTPHHSGTSPNTSPKRNGVVSLTCKWGANSIIKNTTLIIYPLGDNTITIDSRKNIILDFIPLFSMNSLEISTLLKSIWTTKRWFMGVYSCDNYIQIVDKLNLNEKSFVICNTESSTHVGSHWVLIFRNKSKFCFVDSLNLNKRLLGICILKLLKRINKTFEILPFQLQDNNSTTCGLYTIFFAYYLSLNIPFNEVIKLFDENFKKLNDIFITNWKYKYFQIL